MAIKMVNSEGCTHADVYRCDFIVDTNADFENLPKCCVGSTALSAESGDVMIVNASSNWVKMGG
jgi:hypothetical protein